jgi:hypothetical protein
MGGFRPERLNQKIEFEISGYQTSVPPVFILIILPRDRSGLTHELSFQSGDSPSLFTLFTSVNVFVSGSVTIYPREYTPR